MVQFSSALKRTMYDFKNSFFPNFLLIHRAKHIFSRDMFCLYHFRAKIHGVTSTRNLTYFYKTRDNWDLVHDAAYVGQKKIRILWWQQHKRERLKSLRIQSITKNPYRTFRILKELLGILRNFIKHQGSSTMFKELQETSRNFKEL